MSLSLGVKRSLCCRKTAEKRAGAGGSKLSFERRGLDIVMLDRLENREFSSTEEGEPIPVMRVKPRKHFIQVLQHLQGLRIP